MPSIRLVDLGGNEILNIRPQYPNANDPIACTEFNLGWPEHRESMHERAGLSGSIDLTKYHGPRTITFDLRLRNTTTTTKEQTLDTLNYVSAPNNCFYVYARRDGWAEERRMKVRATSLSCASNRQSANLFTAAVSYVCPSGVMEAASETSTLINPPASTGLGLSFPLLWPNPATVEFVQPGIFFEPSASGMEADVLNPGTLPSPMIMRVTGRIENPTIYNHTTGKQMTFKDLLLTTEDTMVIDTDEGTVTVNNTSFYSKIDWSRSSWLELVPGVNKMEFVGSNMDDNSQLTVITRARWI